MQDDGNVGWYAGVAAAFGQPSSVAPPLPFVSEDCLFLNVWSPVTASDARLPVMVWIHGGGNRGGWSFEPNYRGLELAARGAVVVSIQYRLGVFGFLAHAQLSAEHPRATSGNYGILDQIAALRWVGRHIAAFGGNPHNVTVFGESAGAGDINYLLLSPLADGLFHRAIAQSGGWPADQRRTLAEAEAAGARLLAAAGKSGIADLRALSAEALLALAAEHMGDYPDPAVDGYLLPEAPAELLKEGAFRRMPVLFGTNADEDRTLIEAASEARAADYAAAQFHCPTRRFADAFAAQNAPAYLYRFARVRPGEHSLGAYHGAEIPYVFGTHDDWLPGDAADARLTERMMAYWLNFARSGDPNGEGLPNWPRWRAGGEALMLDDPVRADAVDWSRCSDS